MILCVLYVRIVKVTFVSFKQTGTFSDSFLVLSEENENVEDQPQKNVEDQRQNKVIVITTIDDQAAVSSVDLDIGNATPPSNKKKKEKKKKLNVKGILSKCH